MSSRTCLHWKWSYLVPLTEAQELVDAARLHEGHGELLVGQQPGRQLHSRQAAPQVRPRQASQHHAQTFLLQQQDDSRESNTEPYVSLSRRPRRRLESI